MIHIPMNRSRPEHNGWALVGALCPSMNRAIRDGALSLRCGAVSRLAPRRGIAAGYVVAFALLILVAGRASASPGDPYADFVLAYSPGGLTESPVGSGNFFNSAAEALGGPDAAARPTVPSGHVVQLGQGGSLTLGFDDPIVNKAAGARADNPLGVDFVVYGNAFEQGFSGSGLYFREPGFVEVAQKQAGGGPGTFYLILPDKLPANLVGGVDSGSGATLPAYYADVHPVDGSGNTLIAPEQAGSAGGDAFILERAVLESSPGVPLLDGQNNPQFVALDHVDFVRITDAIVNDGDAQIGGYTTDIDAVVALPAVPEPGMLAAGLVFLVVFGRGARGACPDEPIGVDGV